jgi:hypothetical protein
MFGLFRNTGTAAIILATALSGCEATPVSKAGAGDINYEGLATVPARRFDVAQVRPRTDFGAYARVMLAAPVLAYRTPDRRKHEFPLTQEQKDRFSAALAAAFAKEFATLEVLEVTDTAGPGTLTLGVRVQDIAVSIEPRTLGRAGRATALLEASGDAVIVIELRDSQSNEILARGVDAGSASGGALRTSDDELRTRFETADKLVGKWAAQARSSLENLLRDRR